MPGGSRSSGTQTVTQTTELPEWQEEHLQRIASEAGRTYDADFGGFDPYPGATYVPMTGSERTAADWTRNLIGNNGLLAPTMQGWGDIQSGGGMQGDQRGALTAAQNSAAGFGNVYDRTQAPSASERNLPLMGTGTQSLHSRLGGLLGGPTNAQQFTTGIAAGHSLPGEGGLADVERSLRGQSASQQYGMPIAGGAQLDGQQGLRGFLASNAPMMSERNLHGMGSGSQSLSQRFGGQLAGPSQSQQSGAGIAGGQQIAGQQGMQNWVRTGGPLSSEANLQGIARGDFLGGSNPYLDDIISNTTQRAQDATAGLFSGAGRYGGGAHQGVAAREAGEIATEFLGREYDQERQRQLQAAGQIDQATLGRRGQELAGLGQQADVDATRRAQQMQAAGQMDDAQLARVGAQAGFVGSDLDRRMAAYGQMDDVALARRGQELEGLGQQTQADATRRGQQMQMLGQIDDATLGRAGARAGIMGQQADIGATRRGQQIQASGLLDDALLNRVGAQAGLLGGDFDRRMAASGQMDSAQQARLQQALGALQGGAGVNLSAAGQYGGARDALMQNMAMAPALREMQFDDPNRLMGLGAAERGELQTELQTNVDRFRDEQLAPLRELEMYQGLVSGLPDLSSRIESTTGTVPRGSPIAGLLGGGISGGASLGSVFGLPGAIGGGLLGALGGLF